MDVADQPLAQELATFEKKREDLLASDPGRFVLIKGDEIAGVYDTEMDAIRVGYERFGLGTFLVRQVTLTDPEIRISSIAIGL